MVIVDRSYDSCNCIAAFAKMYDGQQRSLISITTYFLGFIMFQIAQFEYIYNMVWIIKSEQNVFREKIGRTRK